MSRGQDEGRRERKVCMVVAIRGLIKTSKANIKHCNCI
jgi:hypothetical protein